MMVVAIAKRPGDHETTGKAQGNRVKEIMLR
jgi:hypothetical protein